MSTHTRFFGIVAGVVAFAALAGCARKRAATAAIALVRVRDRAQEAASASRPL